MANRDELIQEAIDAIVNYDAAAADDVARARSGRRHRPRRDHQRGLRGRHQPGRRRLRERRGLPARADAGRRGHGRRHRGLQRRPRGRPAEAKGVMVIGTVQGDVHDIGKAIVIAYLKAHGYEVTDCGRDVPADTFIARAKELQRRRHRHERPADHHDGRAEEGHQPRSRTRACPTRRSSAAPPARSAGPTRSAPTPTPKTPPTASRRSTPCWASKTSPQGRRRRAPAERNHPGAGSGIAPESAPSAWVLPSCRPRPDGPVAALGSAAAFGDLCVQRLLHLGKEPEQAPAFVV